ncbi:MAG: hypothetical protein HDR86_05620 [Bacteroides sp.]|nr:hypothetical protein [Bacteroides sp.]
MFQQLLQLIANNPNTTKNVVSGIQFAYQLSKEISEKEDLDKNLTDYDRKRIDERKKYNISKYNELFPQIRTLVIKSSSKPEVTINSYALTASLDYKKIEIGLIKLGDVDNTWGPVSLRSSAAIGSIKSFVKELTRSIVRLIWLREVEPFLADEDKKYINNIVRPKIAIAVKECCQLSPINGKTVMFERKPNYCTLNIALKTIGIQKSADELKQVGEYKTTDEFIEEICYFYENQHFIYRFID